MRLKVGDTIIVITGKDSGKKGKITQIFPDDAKIVVDGVNKMVKHIKPRSKDQKGQRIEFFGPIQVSNAMLVCPSCKKQTRVGYSMIGNEKKRICKKCKEAVK